MYTRIPIYENTNDNIVGIINIKDFLLIEDKEKILEVKDVNFAFLVYETPANPCSERIVIQQWFREHGMSIEEWQP